MATLPQRLLPLLLVFGLGSAPAQEPPRIWRVCVSDLSVPPYLYNDPSRPGLLERMLVEAGRQVGFSVLLLRYPVKRCRTMVSSGDADAMLAAPTPANQAELQFPMKAGAVDAGRRMVKLNVVWVRRSDSKLDWDGLSLGPQPHSLTVGTRRSMRSVIDPLQALGFKVDETALTTHQLLMKVAARRVDIGVALQEEVEFAMHDAALTSLVVLPKAFLSADYYAVIRPNPPPEMIDRIESWWTLLGRLRDAPEYRP